MTHPAEQKCHNCYYYSNGTANRGDCRFDPPAVNGSWPTVNCNQWCGAWSEDGIARWQGPPGPGWSEGSGAPVAPGKLRDMYLDTATANVYRWNDGWAIVGNIRGAQGDPGSAGTAGSRWYEGQGNPQAPANPSDLYLDTITGNVWQWQADWQQVGNIRGVAGDEGPIGPPGVVGMQSTTLQTEPDGTVIWTFNTPFQQIPRITCDIVNQGNLPMLWNITAITPEFVALRIWALQLLPANLLLLSLLNSFNVSAGANVGGVTLSLAAFPVEG